MYQSLKNNRKIILILGCFLILLTTFAFVIGKTTEKEVVLTDEQSEIMTQIEQSQDFSLRVLGNSDSPLKIVETRVKQIPANQFTALTGKKAHFAILSSVPEVKLLNTSSMPIKNFSLIIRDPIGKHTRGLNSKRNLNIKPGATFTIKRQHFISLLALRGKNQSFESGMNVDKFWIEFADPSALYVTVGQLEFQNGEIWQIKEGGEVQ